ncbi:MAG: phage major capsid protein [Rhodobacteraceae bacterium]|nr:MAG: phage major capsid protein [Paracoccaceae bacterium]
MDKLEFKASFAVDEAGTITGIASPFGTADRGGDIARKGAFAGAKPPLPMLFNHDQGTPIGVWDSLTETAAGLEVKGRLLVEDVARAAEVRALILAGGLSGLSIGYIATKKAARAGGGRELLAMDLFEISIVAVPMHPGAKITGVKAIGAGKDAMTLEEMQAELAKLEAKHAGAIADAVAAAVAPYVQRLDKLEVKSNRPGTGDPSDEPSLEHKAFQAYLQRGPMAGEAELKALTLASDPNGGYLAPPEMSTEILRDIVEMSPIRSLASVRGTNSPSVVYPTRKPMGNAIWDDEQDTETETTTTNIFGQLEVSTKGMSTYVDISNMLLQDAPQAETEVRECLTEDFAKKETTAFATGNGIAQPEGFLTNTSVATFANGGAVLSADKLISFLYSITPTYRNAGAWVMNGTTLGLVRQLKDTTNNYLWQPSLQAGQPETLLGRPIVEVIDMPDVAAAATPIIYGDFSGYRILDRLAMSILVDPYSQATFKRTRFHAGRRVGGKVIMPAKFKKLLMS